MPAQDCGGLAECGCCPTAELSGVGAARDRWVLWGAGHVVCAGGGHQELGLDKAAAPLLTQTPAMAWLSLRVLQHICAHFAAWFVLWTLCRGLVVF